MLVTVLATKMWVFAWIPFGLLLANGLNLRRVLTKEAADKTGQHNDTCDK